MQSRNEDILQAMIDGTAASTLPPPQSRNEALLLQVLDKMNGLDPSGDAERAAESAEEAAASAQQAAVSATQAQAAAAIASAYAPSDTLPPADITSCDYGVEGNMSSVIAEINPVQDLHGYSNPWPAGGGKNLLNIDAIHVGKSYTGGDNSNRAAMTLSVPEGTYTVSIQNADGFSEIRTGRSKVEYPIPSLDGYVETVTLDNSTKSRQVVINSTYPYIYVFMSKTAITLDDCKLCRMMVESGSTATAFAPYSNICPISCYDSVEVVRTGKNLLDPSLLKDQAGWNTSAITLAPNTNYTMSTNAAASDTSGLVLYFNTTNVDGGSSANIVQNGHSVTQNSGSSGVLYISQRRISGSDSFANYHYQLESGSTATAYEHYTGPGRRS